MSSEPGWMIMLDSHVSSAAQRYNLSENEVWDILGRKEKNARTKTKHKTNPVL